MSAPSISVIVPIYNREKFLGKCINSLLTQTLSNSEFIFVDDASTDRSIAIVKHAAAYDYRIRLIEHAVNLGPGAARNTGITASKAEYITFVDSDDVVDPNFLERLYEASEGGRYDIVESGCRAVDYNNVPLWEYVPDNRRIDVLDARTDSFFLLWQWGMPQKLWRRRLFEVNKIVFPEKIFFEDIAVLPFVITCSNNLNSIDYVGYNYIQHGNSITNLLTVKHVFDLLRAYEHFASSLRSNGTWHKYREAYDRARNMSVDYLRGLIESGNNRNLGELLTKLHYEIIMQKIYPSNAEIDLLQNEYMQISQ